MFCTVGDEESLYGSARGEGSPSPGGQELMDNIMDETETIDSEEMKGAGSKTSSELGWSRGR